jgi:type IV pilus assembly protein PilW
MSKGKIFNRRESGFSLVELMVGLVIGLFATLVIMQVFSVFEGQRRSTSGTADAQTNGTIALMQLQRHFQTAGYGMPMPMADLENNLLKCDSVAGAALFPIVIQDSASAAGDSVTSRYSTSAPGGGVPITISNANNATPEGMQVANNIGCGNDREMTTIKYNDTFQDLTDTTAQNASQPENKVMIMRGNLCGSAVIAQQPTNVAAAVATDADTSFIKIVAAPTGLTPVDTDKLSCMGSYLDHILDVNLATNELRLNGDPIVSEVVSMQAQYGISAVGTSNAVTAWVDATGTWSVASLAANLDNRNRIKAVRVAIALRNGFKEKAAVTPNAALPWRAADGTALMTLSVAHLPDWANYRYRVYGTSVPLRNMIWSREAI